MNSYEAEKADGSSRAVPGEQSFLVLAFSRGHNHSSVNSLCAVGIG